MKATTLLLMTAGLLFPSLASAQIVEYYGLDAIGNVRVVTDQQGKVIERHDYLPFGEECTTGPCANNPGFGAGQSRKFTGKERDAESGLDYFGARYYGSKSGRFTSVDPVFTWQDNLVDPQRWNRYAYARNHPLKYTDPDGRAIDIFVDAGFIGYDISDLVATYRSGQSPTPTQWLALGGDVVGAAIPFATGFGMAIRASSKAEHAVEAGRAAERLIEANRARGVESEARVLRELGEAKNTEKVLGREGASIPDYANRTTIGEIKDTQRVTNSRQMRIQREAAEASGRQHVVHTGTDTRVSRSVEEAGTIVERQSSLGPRQE